MRSSLTFFPFCRSINIEKHFQVLCRGKKEKRGYMIKRRKEGRGSRKGGTTTSNYFLFSTPLPLASLFHYLPFSPSPLSLSLSCLLSPLLLSGSVQEMERHQQQRPVETEARLDLRWLFGAHRHPLVHAGIFWDELGNWNELEGRVST